MKVILLEELKGRGGEGDVIDVARGFAVNYLFPRRVAIEATPGALKQLEQRKHNIQKREETRTGDANAMFEKLDGKVVTIEAKVGEEGRLFGSITSPMVADAITAQLGVEVDRKKIETHGAIKEVGPHAVDISIYRETKATVTIEVVAEGAAAAAAAAEAVVEEPAAEVEVAEDVAEEAVEETADEAVEAE